MTIYKSKSNYRKIWESVHGPIPKDADGRSYEIHHIDGNHSNDDISNLHCVTIQEHYDIHLNQGDWSACLAIAARMSVSPEEKSRLASAAVKKQIKDGRHNWSGPDHNKKMVEAGTHNFMTRPDGTNLNIDRVKAGTHHLLRRPDGSSITGDLTKAGRNPFSRRPDGSTVAGITANKLVEEGTHHFLGSDVNKKALEAGVHSSQTKVTCLGCNKVTSVSNFVLFHGDLCPKITGKNHKAPIIPMVTCVCCQKTVDLGNFKRWHGSNCKKTPR